MDYDEAVEKAREALGPPPLQEFANNLKDEFDINLMTTPYGELIGQAVEYIIDKDQNIRKTLASVLRDETLFIEEPVTFKDVEDIGLLNVTIFDVLREALSRYMIAELKGEKP